VNSVSRSLGWQSLCVGLALALLMSLGFWQLRRLDWKEALIARVEARANLAPVALPPLSDWPRLAADDYDIRHVQMRGRFDFAGLALVFSQAPPRGGMEPGFLVLTPLRLESGGVVLVNRGFVAQSKAAGGAWRSGPGGAVTITGLMRSPQARNSFTPADDPAKSQWYTLDPVNIAAALKLEEAAPFLVQQDSGGESALGQADGLSRVFTGAPEIPNNHFSYAVTWFGLAAALAIVFAFYARGRLAAR
jgi:surfeit locus 1 family protein